MSHAPYATGYCTNVHAGATLEATRQNLERHAVAVKQWTRDQLRAMAHELAARDPEALADQLMLVLEGVYASVASLGTTGPAARARALVEQLLPDHA